MANPNWYKGMPRVPTSGRKKGTRNKHTTAVKKAQQVATLQMAQRTPEIVAAASEMILDKNPEYLGPGEAHRNLAALCLADSAGDGGGRQHERGCCW